MNFTNLYSAHTKGALLDYHDEILHIFQEKLSSKADLFVDLVNYYKGLPIVYPAKVLAVQYDNLEIDVNPHQAAAVANDKYTLIRSRFFPHDIVAHVQYVDINRHTVAFNKLCYVELLADNRAALRLNLEPPAEAVVKYESGIFAGAIPDISINGLAVLTDSCMHLDAGVDVSVQFMLPDLEQQRHIPMVVPAKLVAFEADKAPYRFRFRISPEKDQEKMISKYCLQRQVEIIRNLKEIVER